MAQLRAALPARGNGGAARAGPQDLTVVAGDPMSRPESTSLTSAVFGRETLDAIAADLAPHIGPIAPMAVRSAARKVMTLARLAELLGKEIADESARAAFVKKYTAAAPSSPFGAPSRPASSRLPSAPPSAPVSGPAATFDAAVLAKAEVVLAQHIGAVAKIVVRRAAAKARDEPELYLMIADEIEDKDEKKRGLGIGMIFKNDQVIRAHVHYAMVYLVKDAQHLRVKPLRSKCLRVGLVGRLARH